LLTPQDELLTLSHPNLNTDIRGIGIFPLVNTPSFYVLTGQGCYFVTSFIPQQSEDPQAPAAEHVNIAVSPNPFRSSLSITTSDKTSREIIYQIYNPKGQLLHTIKAAGKDTAVWNGTDKTGKRVSKGLYIIKASMGGRVSVMKALKM